jgi:hypothetical protein
VYSYRVGSTRGSTSPSTRGGGRAPVRLKQSSVVCIAAREYAGKNVCSSLDHSVLDASS